MSTTTNLSTLVINYLTQAQYDAAEQAGTLDENQLYFTPDEGGSIVETDPVFSASPAAGITAADITNWNGKTANTITLNGTQTASPSFYAPTGAGTSGYYLKSSGSGAPTWASISIPSAGTSASAVGTSASGGSASTYSKSDHVHNITSSTITSALGYTPYNSTNPSGYVTTDEKLALTSATSGSSYDIIVGSGTTAATRQYDASSGFTYTGTAGQGSGSSAGTVTLTLGNSRATETPGNRRGYITIYGSGTYGTTILASPSSANNSVTLPGTGGTLAIVEDFYAPSTVGPMTWTSTSAGNTIAVSKTGLLYWDGRYGSNTNGFLQYCKNGTILGSDVSQSTNPLKDYVTLQGKTGSTWIYRKWNSGLQECWYHGSITFTTAGASFQGWYRSTETISLPTATGFTAFADTAAVIGNGAYNAHIFTAAGLVKTNGTQIEVQLLGGSAVAASTTATQCNIYVCGFARS